MLTFAIVAPRVHRPDQYAQRFVTQAPKVLDGGCVGWSSRLSPGEPHNSLFAGVMNGVPKRLSGYEGHDLGAVIGLPDATSCGRSANTHALISLTRVAENWWPTLC